MIYNSLTVKAKAGKRLKTLESILKDYLSSGMIIDAINILILIVNQFAPDEIMQYFRLFIITKLPQCLEKMERLEVTFIKTYYKEQYWSLFKVVLFNFCFAHIIAIFLSAMADINPQDNWQHNKGIS
jgi:energy-coupling factor transporter transmembrane protein EcfT